MSHMDRKLYPEQDIRVQ